MRHTNGISDLEVRAVDGGEIAVAMWRWGQVAVDPCPQFRLSRDQMGRGGSGFGFKAFGRHCLFDSCEAKKTRKQAQRIRSQTLQGCSQAFKQKPKAFRRSVFDEQGV